MPESSTVISVVKALGHTQGGGDWRLSLVSWAVMLHSLGSHESSELEAHGTALVCNPPYALSQVDAGEKGVLPHKEKTVGALPLLRFLGSAPCLSFFG